jgi:molybdate transport system ATP-binding protein
MIEFALEKQLTGADGALALKVEGQIADRALQALFGPSGAGKTSILRMLAGLTRPDHGRIVVDGCVWFDSTRGIDLPTRQRSIGMVFQDYALFPNLNVRDNIAYAAGPGEGAWIAELLALTGLQELVGQMPAALSGGQKQRVALARALARKPAVLLLDEPLAALDHAWRAQLQEQLQRLHQRCGLTTLLVTHDIGEVFRLAQGVFKLTAGQIVAAGTAADVFLQARMGGKFTLRAQVLAIRREEIVTIMTPLIGGELVDVIADQEEIAGMAPGDFVSVAAKAFSPLIYK